MRTRMKLILPILLSFLMLGCRRQTIQVDPTEPAPSGGELTEQTEPTHSGGELFCLIDTEEEAREIAQLYGIEFVSFQHGVAVFRTEEDPAAVLERGKTKGWPELSINHTATAS